MNHSPQRLAEISQVLHQVGGTDLRAAVAALLRTLGYASPKTLETGGDPATLLGAVDIAPNRFDTLGGVARWRSLDVVFQLTGDELPALARGSAPSTAGEYRTGEIDSFVFLTLDLDDGPWTRRQLVGITRELNRGFAMPAIVLFRHAGHATLAVIDRRKHLRDAARDVVGGRISLVKDIDLASPHRAHIEIFADLTLGQLRPAPTDFRSLYDAWLKALSAAELNRRFYSDLADWFAWASSEGVVQFPPGQGNGKDARAIGLIRLLTRLMFVWFIKQKNLVPDTLFNTEDLGRLLIEPPDARPDGHGYYVAVLQNLFFACLNTEMDERGWLPRDASGGTSAYLVHSKLRQRAMFADPEAAKLAFDHVPFLNGGLFDCLDVAIKATDPRAERAGREGRRGLVMRVDGFSEEPERQARLPNRLFFGGQADADMSEFYGRPTRRTALGLIDLFERYKFTVEENTPLEEEAALDPELLGKVFENLLASYNEDTKTTARNKSGSFYTPREVVDFMVDEALVAYLGPTLSPPAADGLRPRIASLDFGPALDELALESPAAPAMGRVQNPADERRLRDLLSYAAPMPDFSDAEGDLLVAAIESCRAIDPAVGSGAFPLGLLQKLVHVLHRLDPGGAKWFAANLAPYERAISAAQAIKSPSDRADAVASAIARRNAFRDSFPKGHHADYARKLYLIEGCLHGVDIQPIAVQIAKLRCFISLAVEQVVDDSKRNRGITPLPNLEMKFVAANALGFVRSKWAGLRDPAITALENERAEVSRALFSARDSRSKRRARDRIEAIRGELGELLESSGFPADDARIMAAWDAFDANAAAPFFDPEWMFNVGDHAEGCFDIILANPPYVRQEKIEDYKNPDGSVANPKSKLREHYETFSGKADLYVYFYERSVRMLKSGGVIAFITSNKWYRAGYGAKLRTYLNQETHFRAILDFGDAEVFEAIAYPTIVVAQRRVARLGIVDPKETFRALNWETGQTSEGFPVRFENEAFSMPQAALSPSGWQLERQGKRDLLARLRAAGAPFGEWCGGQFFRGPVTGLNKAFVLSGADRERLAKSTPAPDDLFKPFVRGRDVKRWQVAYADLWLLFIPWHFPLHDGDIQGSSSKAESAFRDQYPDIYAYLEGFKPELLRRSPSETGRLYEWYALQRWAADFWQQFKQPKIFVAAIAEKPTAAVDRQGLWPNNKSSVFVTNRPEFAAAIFNSTVSGWYSRQIYSTKQGGFLDFEPRYSSTLPIPAATPEQEALVAIATAAVVAGAQPRALIESMINAFLYELYFPEDFTALGLSAFAAARDAGLSSLATHSGAALAEAAGEWSRKLSDPASPLYATLYSLQSIEAVRIIEGRK